MKYLDLRFHRDPETGLPHIYDHGVTEEEVRQILTAPAEDRPGTEGSWVALGQTQAGRYLKVIYVPEEGLASVFVITAFDLAGKALKAFRRRRRKRQ